MKIVSLEDDEPFWDLMQDALKRAFPDAELLWINCESDFYARLDEFDKAPPDVFLLDIMVKWAPPSENIPTPPEEVKRENYYRAGLRCRSLLLQKPRDCRRARDSVYGTGGIRCQECRERPAAEYHSRQEGYDV